MHAKDLRNRLHAGPLDYNAVFRTFVPGSTILPDRRRVGLMNLRGSEIEKYLKQKGKKGNDYVHWQGFDAELSYNGNDEGSIDSSSLLNNTVYRVVLPYSVAKAFSADGAQSTIEVVDADFEVLSWNVIDGLASYLPANPQ